MNLQTDYSSLLEHRERVARFRRDAEQLRLARSSRRRTRRRASSRPWWRRLTGTGQVRPARTA